MQNVKSSDILKFITIQIKGLKNLKTITYIFFILNYAQADLKKMLKDS